MSTEHTNDEIDLAQLLQLLSNMFRRVVRQFLLFISFLKKKAILFISLIVIGGIAGYFLDQSLNTKYSYEQEVIIEPKYGTSKYIYDFIAELQKSFKDESFLKKIGISESQKQNIKKISIEPIIQATDVLDNLQERYEGKEFFKNVVGELEEEELEEEKYINFYKNHKIVIEFKNKEETNNEIIDNIFLYLKSNVYYQNKQKLILEQTAVNLARNQKSLVFIDQYLENINKNPIGTNTNDVIVFGDESKTMTIGSLLVQKEELLLSIGAQEEILVLDKELFAIVEHGAIVEKSKVLINRMLTMIPLALCGIVILFFGVKQAFKRMNEFVSTS